jgi:hypothetical protein
MKLAKILYVGIVVTTLSSCGSEPLTQLEKADKSQTDTVVNFSDKVEEQLKMTDTSIIIFENTMHERDALVKENKELKIELKTTKDSLDVAKKQIKKRTVLQKILGLNKDTIQTIQKDTNSHDK